MILCYLLIFLFFNLIKTAAKCLKLIAGLVSKMSSACGNCQAESQARASDLTQFTYKSFNHSISRVSYVHSSRTTDESLLLRSSLRISKRFRSLSICANAEFDCNTVARTTRTIRFLQRSTPNIEIRRQVPRVKKKMTKLKKNTHTHTRTHARTHTHTSLSLSLSLLVDLPMHFDFLGRKCMHQSLSLYFHLQKTVWIQIRPEWNSGKNVSSI